MHGLTADQLMVLFLALGVLLGTARLLAELVQGFHQPAVIGEILAGVLLGPTVLGTWAPEWNQFLFPAEGPNALALHTIASLSIVLFLLVAGMEVDLSTVWRQGRVALKVGTIGMIVPFLLGLGCGWGFPSLLGQSADADPLIFALFLATALAISALPVIAKTLMDLNLYRTDLGMVVVSAAILNDLAGWIIFAVILGLMPDSGGHGANIPATIALTLAFSGLMVTLGRWGVHRLLPYLQAYGHGAGAVLSFALTLALLAAALTEWIGIHAIFGSFLVGLAIGDSSHLRERTRVIIDQFVSHIFAPLFFATIGLRLNFLAHFDLALVASVLMIACAGKLSGAFLGARWGGVSHRNAWAIAFGMNARGAMEIILGVLALEARLIQQPLFVSLVLMALVTSMMSGPAMLALLRLRQPHGLLRALSPKLFLRDLAARSRRDCIRELTQVACQAARLDPEAIEQMAWRREETLPTGIGHGVALPHARVPGLREPVVAVGFSDAGIDFDAPDGAPAHIVFLVLTPADQPEALLEISAECAKLFRDPTLFEQTLRTHTFTEFLALLRGRAIE